MKKFFIALFFVGLFFITPVKAYTTRTTLFCSITDNNFVAGNKIIQFQTNYNAGNIITCKGIEGVDFEFFRSSGSGRLSLKVKTENHCYKQDNPSCNNKSYIASPSSELAISYNYELWDSYITNASISTVRSASILLNITVKGNTSSTLNFDLDNIKDFGIAQNTPTPTPTPSPTPTPNPISDNSILLDYGENSYIGNAYLPFYIGYKWIENVAGLNKAFYSKIEFAGMYNCNLIQREDNTADIYCPEKTSYRVKLFENLLGEFANFAYMQNCIRYNQSLCTTGKIIEFSIPSDENNLLETCKLVTTNVNLYITAENGEVLYDCANSSYLNNILPPNLGINPGQSGGYPIAYPTQTDNTIKDFLDTNNNIILNWLRNIFSWLFIPSQNDFERYIDQTKVYVNNAYGNTRPFTFYSSLTNITKIKPPNIVIGGKDIFNFQSIRYLLDYDIFKGLTIAILLQIITMYGLLSLLWNILGLIIDTKIPAFKIFENGEERGLSI